MNKDCYWLNKDSRKFLERGYLIEGESAEERINDICKAAAGILRNHKILIKDKVDKTLLNNFEEKFSDYLYRGFYSLSSPIWANFGRERGLPISCFGSFIPDSMEGIMYKLAEVGMMTKYGGGTSAFFGDLRGIYGIFAFYGVVQ